MKQKEASKDSYISCEETKNEHVLAMSKIKTFFEALQTTPEIDMRDNRGKTHNLPLILLEFVCALLCNRDGNQSSIHRHMQAHHQRLSEELGLMDTVPKKQYVAPIFR